MRRRAKLWSDRHARFVHKLEEHGFTVTIHWIDTQCFESVSIYTIRFHNFIGEYTTPLEAWQAHKPKMV